ncbi:elongation factor Tu [Nitrosopumilus sp. b1]|uniref:EF-Tu/IF-2/RF-3 family GTPase n=1 Tax=Nitrosopumilus sp. b1 TaxID=2109907 RepID=UPI0015F4AAC9|nr:EF-Tu/IF-2/RF-3 family GTPase [Nitrosopumilus sp. b1]KAF6243374.1 elongation factor Tu [Nitrosopumilus sp. b1]
MVKSINFAVLGEQTIASDFGKKGTATDLTLYDKKESDVIRTWVAPNGFPDKIQPLFQAINLAEYPIVYLGSLDKFAGEQMVALDVLQKKEGILSHTYEVDESRLNTMIKGTVLEQYRKVESQKIKEEILKFQPLQTDGKTKIVIDHCFDVKGVGTVILGKVTSGKIKQYDNLKLLPAGLDIMVKSIQMHDEPVEEATSPARVGLSIKGAKPEEISRGDILCEDDSMPVKSEIELDFKKNPFYKGDVTENQMCMVNIGLQIKAAKFSSVNPLKLSFEKPAVCDKSDTCVILKPESTSIRILGSGKII